MARVDTARKTLYHAGAAVAANYTVTLLAVAQGLLEGAGVERGYGMYRPSRHQRNQCRSPSHDQ